MSHSGHFIKQIYFNSIKVRLKLSYLSSGPLHSQSFQFHKGTIKTSAHVEVYVDVSYFNSIKVRLKPLMVASLMPFLIFQFHKGTIKTHLKPSTQLSSVISIP